MVNEELKVGTKLRTSENGVYVYIINAINTIPAKKLKLYYVEVLPGQGAMGIAPIWLDETALRAYYPVIVGATPVAAPDLPSSDVAGAAGDAAPTVRMQVYAEPVLGKTRLETGVLRPDASAAEKLGYVHRVLESYLQTHPEHSKGMEEATQYVWELSMTLPVHYSETEKPHEVIKNWNGDCPYCQNGDLDAGRNDFGGSTVWQDMECLHCHRGYVEQYVLTGAHKGDDTLALTYEGEVLQVIPDLRNDLEGLASAEKKLAHYNTAHCIELVIGMIPER